MLFEQVKKIRPQGIIVFRTFALNVDYFLLHFLEKLGRFLRSAPAPHGYGGTKISLTLSASGIPYSMLSTTPSQFSVHTFQGCSCLHDKVTRSSD
jgi:hypothetical protein